MSENAPKKSNVFVLPTVKTLENASNEQVEATLKHFGLSSEMPDSLKELLGIKDGGDAPTPK